MSKSIFVIAALCVAVFGLYAVSASDYRIEGLQDLSISIAGANVVLTWSPVASANAYKVYSRSTPDGEFLEDLSGTFAGESWSVPVLESRRFYRVTALTADNMVSVAGGTVAGITVNSFSIGKYEITTADWEAVMGSGGGSNMARANLSWFAAIEYCNRRSMLEGLTACYSYGSYGTDPATWPGNWDDYSENNANVACNWDANGYRLPSGAEWEYAARGGLQSQGYIYSGSNSVGDVGWYNGNSGWYAHPVGQLAPNELGIYDMSGNLWEWVWDIWGPYDRVLRGGSFESDGGFSAVSTVHHYYAIANQGSIGFRVCRNA